MKTLITATLGEEITAAALLTDSLMRQVQDLETGPIGCDIQWNVELQRKMRHFNTLCEVLHDLRELEAYDATRDHDDPDMEFHPQYGPEPIMDIKLIESQMDQVIQEAHPQELFDALRTPVVPTVATVGFRHEPRGYSFIDVTMTDGEFIAGIIRYFNDEVTYWASDIIGLTKERVNDCWMDTDKAYLRRR